MASTMVALRVICWVVRLVELKGQCAVDWRVGSLVETTVLSTAVPKAAWLAATTGSHLAGQTG